MIKEDLRIGNLITAAHQSDSPILRVIAVGELATYCKDSTGRGYNVNHSDALPIPITPEILQRCGMDKPLKFEEGEMEVLNNRLYIFSKDSYAFNQGIPIELKGFHHLQNVLYDLCSIELTLNTQDNAKRK